MVNQNLLRKIDAHRSQHLEKLDPLEIGSHFYSLTLLYWPETEVISYWPRYRSKINCIGPRTPPDRWANMKSFDL